MKKTVLIIFIFCSYLCSFAQVEEAFVQFSEPNIVNKPIDSLNAKKVEETVLKYANAILENHDLEGALAVCSVPFAWDRKEIISDLASLRKHHLDMLKQKESKQKYKILVMKSNVLGFKSVIYENVIPIEIYMVLLTLKIKTKNKVNEERILFAVEYKNEVRIIGISD
jgi:hypothetical protein